MRLYAGEIYLYSFGMCEREVTKEKMVDQKRAQRERTPKNPRYAYSNKI